MGNTPPVPAQGSQQTGGQAVAQNVANAPNAQATTNATASAQQTAAGPNPVNHPGQAGPSGLNQGQYPAVQNVPMFQNPGVQQQPTAYQGVPQFAGQPTYLPNPYGQQSQYTQAGQHAQPGQYAQTGQYTQAGQYVPPAQYAQAGQYAHASYQQQYGQAQYQPQFTQMPHQPGVAPWGKPDIGAFLRACDSIVPFDGSNWGRYKFDFDLLCMSFGLKGFLIPPQPYRWGFAYPNYDPSPEAEYTQLVIAVFNGLFKTCTEVVRYKIKPCLNGAYPASEAWAFLSKEYSSETQMNASNLLHQLASVKMVPGQHEAYIAEKLWLRDQLLSKN